MLKYLSCAGWHGASSSLWLDTDCGFRRGFNGVFSFYGSGDWNGFGYYGRGVAVVKSAVRA